MKVIPLLLLLSIGIGCSAFPQYADKDGNLNLVAIADLASTAATKAVEGYALSQEDDPDWIGYGVATILTLLGLGGAGKGIAAVRESGKKAGKLEA